MSSQRLGQLLMLTLVTFLLSRTGNGSLALADEAIVFLSARDGASAVYRVAPDGTDLRRVTGVGVTTPEYAPAVSPDGTTIAFARRYAGLWKMNIDGTNPVLVTGLGGSFNGINWSPDGTEILFQNVRTCGEDIYSIHPDGTNLRIVVDGGSDIPEPIVYRTSWSSLNKIAVIGYYCGNHTGNAYTLNPDRTNVQIILANAIDVRWSPDGRKLAVTRWAGIVGVYHVWVIDADGSNPIQITTGNVNDSFPFWSPDGSRIVFARAATGGANLWIVNIDGSGLHQLTFGNSGDQEPFWFKTLSVSSVYPTANQLNVSKSTNIVVSFTQDVNPVTLDNTTIRVSGSQSGFHVGSLSYDISSKTLTLNPNADFRFGEVVSVTLNSGIRGTGGIPLRPYVTTFMIAATGGSAIFTNTQSVGSGATGHFVLSADLNRNEGLDLVAAFDGSQTVAVLNNNGLATFNQTSAVNVGGRPYTMTAGDFDGDGDMDLAVSNAWHDNKIHILKNDGSGNLSETSFIGLAGDTHGVAAGDFDGDGDPDLAVGYWPNSLAILKNNGSGSFTQSSTQLVGLNPESIAIADIDGDGDLDLAVTTAEMLNSVYIYKNDGTGLFVQHSTISTGISSIPITVVSGDLDADGDVDLALVNGASNSISVLKNDGSGNFVVSSASFVGNSPNSLVACDVDGDGDLDLCVAVSGSTQSIIILKNNGDATFTQFSSTPAGRDPRSITSGDFDGDGDIDLAVANFSSNDVSILINESNAAPTIACSGTITAQNIRNQCDQSVEFAATATGTPTPSVVCKIGDDIITSPHTFPVGTTTVNCTATNVAGSDNCSFTVRVQDAQNPTITCPINIRQRPTSLAGAVVTYDTPIGSDNCSATTEQTAGLASGSTFPLGVTTNTFVATDPEGNTTTCSFTVTVPDPHCTPGNKVNVCHNGHTICISVNALQAHLNHGDLLGPCSLGKIGEVAEIPERFGLEQNYPNPFNPTTTIRFGLPINAYVSLAVYNTLGQRMSQVVNEQLSAGYHDVAFDASQLTSGMYFYRLQAGDYVATKKFLLLK